MRERQLEDLLFNHPYLIDPEFEGLVPKGHRQKSKERQRLDLLFELPSGLCIVELKKTNLTHTDLEQLLRYCRIWSRQEQNTLADHHYLIGQRPLDEGHLVRALSQSEYEIRLRYLGEHLPLRLGWDAYTRHYYPLDDDRAATDYLDLRL